MSVEAQVERILGLQLLPQALYEMKLEVEARIDAHIDLLSASNTARGNDYCEVLEALEQIIRAIE